MELQNWSFWFVHWYKSVIHETCSFFSSMKIELQLVFELVKKGSFKKQTLFLFNESRAAKLILLNFELVKKCNSRNKLALFHFNENWASRLILSNFVSSEVVTFKKQAPFLFHESKASRLNRQKSFYLRNRLVFMFS